jgi:hypothetical protein
MFVAAGLVDVQVEAMTLLVRDHRALDNVMGLRSWATTANERGLLGAEDASAWPDAIDRAVASRRFLYAVSSGAPWARTWSWSPACSRA